MASKIHTDNPKHHKYTTVNKYKRKKNRINVLFNNNIKPFNLKNFLIVLEAVIIESTYSWFHFGTYKGHRTIYREPNYHSTFGHNKGEHAPYHGVKGCKIIYDDCNHTSYRVIKNGKCIKAIYKDRKYGTRYIGEKHFKRNVHRFR